MSNDLLLTSVYRKAAISFLVLTIGLLVLVAYVVLPKALIVITPVAKTFDENVTLMVRENLIGEEGEIRGVPITVNLSLEQTFDSTGEEEITENISGNVTLVNNYFKDQSLIRTTRLITQDGVLLRLDASVTVPAGGTVEAQVYLDDEATPISNLQQGRLTIPGLWEGLQDQIYGEINNAFLGDTVTQRVVQTDDITFAQNSLRAKAESEAEILLLDVFESQQEIPEEFRSTWTLQKVDIVDEDWNFEEDLAGAVVDSFSVQGTFTLRGLFFAIEELEENIKETIHGKGEEDFAIEEYELIVNKEESEASVELLIVVKGEVRGISKEDFLESNDVAGLTPEAAIGRLTLNPEVKDVKIEISPFWVKKIPKNRVDIVIISK